MQKVPNQENCMHNLMISEIFRLKRGTSKSKLVSVDPIYILSNKTLEENLELDEDMSDKLATFNGIYKSSA